MRGRVVVWFLAPAVLSVVFRVPQVMATEPSAREEAERLVAQGVQQINRGRPERALTILLDAAHVASDNAEATYWAGIAATQLSRFSDAEDLFRQTLSRDETAIEAALELVRYYVTTDQCSRAQTAFRQFLARSVDPAVTQDGRRLLDRCGGVPTERRIHVNLALGLQYDSNVILEADNPPVSVGDKNDVRAVANLRGTATLWRDEDLTVSANYAFYQSLHTDLSDFDVHQHRAGVDCELKLGERLRGAVGYGFDYVFFGGDDYSRVNALSARLSLLEGDHAATDVSYERKARTYWNTDRFLANALRTGHGQSVGLAERLVTKRATGRVYYYYDLERARVDYWDDNAQRVGTDGTVAVGSALYLTFAAELSRARYRGDFPPYDVHRVDTYQRYSVGAHYLFSERLRLSLSETFITNHSNLDPFEYQRNLVGLFLTVGLL